MCEVFELRQWLPLSGLLSAWSYWRAFPFALEGNWNNAALPEREPDIWWPYITDYHLKSGLITVDSGEPRLIALVPWPSGRILHQAYSSVWTFDWGKFAKPTDQYMPPERPNHNWYSPIFVGNCWLYPIYPIIHVIQPVGMLSVGILLLLVYTTSWPYPYHICLAIHDSLSTTPSNFWLSMLFSPLVGAISPTIS